MVFYETQQWCTVILNYIAKKSLKKIFEPKLKQAMAEQGHTRSLSSKLNLKMNWDCQLGPSVAKLLLNKNMVDM